MKKITLLSVIAGLCIQLQAQYIPTEKTISIGDAMPNLQFSSMLNYKQPTADLSDFKGKLLVLEFWASWCSSCMRMFPKLDSLQNELKDKVQILLVNSQVNDRGLKGEQFFKTWINNNLPAFSIPSVMDDTLLKKILPHKYIPHSVIISPDGSILAFVSPLFLTKDLLQSFINQTMRYGN